MTINEALLALFTIGLLFGLWLGGISQQRNLRILKDLEIRVENLELQKARYQIPFDTPSQRMPHLENESGIHLHLQAVQLRIRT
jgi:hypothetical protein